MLSLDKLKNIDTPARYTGGEARQYIKNAALVSKRVCIAVPAMYEIGMFDLDLKAMYYTINNRKDIWCERCFAPLMDFEQLLREQNEKLYTLESKTPLKDMDIIIFVLSSEMMATNMLTMMNLGGIPTLKQRRKEGFPLVIATGSAVLNPKPFEKFVDVFVMGEMNCVVNELLDKIPSVKDTELKDKVLEKIQDIPGVYIPEVTNGDIHMVKEKHIDLEQVPKNMVVPSIRTMIDKSFVSLSKGCDKNCVMCTSKFAYGTPEHMDTDKAVLKAKKIINATGNTELMLSTNCHGTYPGFPDIIYKLQDLDRPKVKNISFMEVKLNKDNLWLLKYMDQETEIPSIIVGAPTENLQKKLGIDMKDTELTEIVKEVFKAGFNKVRLKYIIGVPGETYEDLSKILLMANKICKLYKDFFDKSPDRYIVEINIYNFKAKPHTPSCFCATNNSEAFELKQRYLKDKNKNEYVIFTAEEGKQSVIETMIARGDEKVADVIYEAFKQGARHDLIEPMFSYEAWQVALNNTGVDIKKYLEEINEKVALPWDNIHVGTSKEELKRIYLNRIKGD